ncbi:MAG TPA: ATP-binding protein [Kofleriaceae bacterium]|jgi:signal transduction histidine kinase|nr:ATP-binding protein [Kofleriaceae bacterium]
MPEFLKQLVSSEGFMPHGHCYLWRPALVWLHVLSDALITLAYTSIPFTLIYFARRRRDLPFEWMFLCFGVFIIACGATHALEIWTLWTPTYWLSGLVKAITAAASLPTAVLLIKLVPRALAVPSPQQLARAHHELQRANESLERRLAERDRAEHALRAAKDAAETAYAELESFSYSVAHDLRAPLRAMSGYSTTLIEDHADRLDADARARLDRIAAGAVRMSEIIDALLSLARLSRPATRREPVDLTRLAHEVVDQLRAGEPGRQVEFIAARDLVVEGDPDLLRVVLDNLLGNAWKFTSKQREARIELGRDDAGGGSAYYIRDNGAGFDMALADRLFAPFKRLHTVSEFAGTGIGLATVQRIVRRHGGRIWADSAPSRGATFHFTLPTQAAVSP